MWGCDIVFGHEDCIQGSDYSFGGRSRAGGRAGKAPPVRRKLYLLHLFVPLRRLGSIRGSLALCFSGPGNRLSP